MKVYFTDWFDVDPEVLEEYGAFSNEGRQKVQKVLTELKMETDESIILINCRRDSKPSASSA